MAHYESSTFTTSGGITWQLHMFTALSGTNNSKLEISIWAVTSKNNKSWWSADNANTYNFESSINSYWIKNQSLTIRTEPGNRKPISDNAPAGFFSVDSYAALTYYSYENTGYNDAKTTIYVSLDLGESGSGKVPMEITAEITIPPKYPLPIPNKPDLSYTTYNITDKSLNNLKWTDSNYSNQTNTLRLYNISATDAMKKFESGEFVYSVFEIKFNNNSNLGYLAYYSYPGPINVGDDNNKINTIYGCIPYYSNNTVVQVSNFALNKDGIFKVDAYNSSSTEIYPYSKRIPKVDLDLLNNKIVVSDVLSDNITEGADGYGLLPFKPGKILPSIVPTNNNYNYPYTGYVELGTSYLPASCYRIACNSSSNYESKFYKFTQFNSAGYIVDGRDLYYNAESVIDGSQYIRLYNIAANKYLNIHRKDSSNEYIDESDLVIDSKVNPVGMSGETVVVPSKCYIELGNDVKKHINLIYYETNFQVELPVYYPELSGTSDTHTITWKKGNIAKSNYIQISPKNIATSISNKNTGKVFAINYNKTTETYDFKESEIIKICKKYTKNNYEFIESKALTYSEYINIIK